MGRTKAETAQMCLRMEPCYVEMLRRIETEEERTATAIVRRAFKEYVLKHYPKLAEEYKIEPTYVDRSN